MDELGDVVLAFGESDEYRWVLRIVRGTFQGPS